MDKRVQGLMEAFRKRKRREEKRMKTDESVWPGRVQYNHHKNMHFMQYKCISTTLILQQNDFIFGKV